jgi:hypothetical protein
LDERRNGQVKGIDHFSTTAISHWLTDPWLPGSCLVRLHTILALSERTQLLKNGADNVNPPAKTPTNGKSEGELTLPSLAARYSLEIEQKVTVNLKISPILGPQVFSNAGRCKDSMLG